MSNKFHINFTLFHKCRPPSDCCAEFEVELITVPAHTTAYQLPTVNCGCILLVMDVTTYSSTTSTTSATSTSSTTATLTESTAVAIVPGATISCSSSQESSTQLKAGLVLFTSANESVCITTGAVSVTLYRSHVNLGGTSDLYRKK